jgi:hypothetical protein
VARQLSLGGGGGGRAPADAGGDWKVFLERKVGALRDTEDSGGAKHQVVRFWREGGAEWAVDREFEIVGRGGMQDVSGAGENDQTVEQVIAVGATASDMQEKIYLSVA